MKRLALVSLVLLAAACSQPSDRLLSPRGSAIDGVQVLVSTETPSGFPGMVLRNVAFVNVSGKALEVAAMETSRTEVEGSEIWSLQPSSTGDRLDWLLPVPASVSATIWV